MRKFERTTPPLIWSERESRWNQQWLKSVRDKPTVKFSWYKHKGQTARVIALPSLKKQTGEHCSFCDGFPIDHVSTETIEHFRPKYSTGFPELAYSWCNLYYCCNACQSYKGESWDENLIAPDATDYEFERYFEFDFTTGAMRPSSTNTIVLEQNRAKVTIESYGLDTAGRRRYRLLELRKWTKIDEGSRRLDDFGCRNFLQTLDTAKA